MLSQQKLLLTPDDKADQAFQPVMNCTNYSRFMLPSLSVSSSAHINSKSGLEIEGSNLDRKDYIC
jgi:hypothetical protein